MISGGNPRLFFLLLSLLSPFVGRVHIFLSRSLSPQVRLTIHSASFCSVLGFGFGVQVHTAQGSILFLTTVRQTGGGVVKSWSSRVRRTAVWGVCLSIQLLIPCLVFPLALLAVCHSIRALSCRRI